MDVQYQLSFLHEKEERSKEEIKRLKKLINKLKDEGLEKMDNYGVKNKYRIVKYKQRILEEKGNILKYITMGKTLANRDVKRKQKKITDVKKRLEQRKKERADKNITF